MFRFGYRRGKGKFLETFGGDASVARERKRTATVERVAAKLSERDTFEGFGGETEQAILGDLLLSFCLVNLSPGAGCDMWPQNLCGAPINHANPFKYSATAVAERGAAVLTAPRHDRGVAVLSGCESVGNLVYGLALIFEVPVSEAYDSERVPSLTESQ